MKKFNEIIINGEDLQKYLKGGNLTFAVFINNLASTLLKLEGYKEFTVANIGTQASARYSAFETVNGIRTQEYNPTRSRILNEDEDEHKISLSITTVTKNGNTEVHTMNIIGDTVTLTVANQIVSTTLSKQLFKITNEGWHLFRNTNNHFDFGTNPEPEEVLKELKSEEEQSNIEFNVWLDVISRAVDKRLKPEPKFILSTSNPFEELFAIVDNSTNKYLAEKEDLNSKLEKLINKMETVCTDEEIQEVKEKLNKMYQPEFKSHQPKMLKFITLEKKNDLDHSVAQEASKLAFADEKDEIPGDLEKLSKVLGDLQEQIFKLDEEIQNMMKKVNK